MTQYIEQQPNEVRRVCKTGQRYTCFSCKKDIVVGDEYFKVRTGAGSRRHITCARKSPGKQPLTEAESEDAVRRQLRPDDGSTKRRRGGGHGYTGGDGMTRI